MRSGWLLLVWLLSGSVGVAAADLAAYTRQFQQAMVQKNQGNTQAAVEAVKSLIRDTTQRLQHEPDNLALRWYHNRFIVEWVMLTDGNVPTELRQTLPADLEQALRHPDKRHNHEVQTLISDSAINLANYYHHRANWDSSNRLLSKLLDQLPSFAPDVSQQYQPLAHVLLGQNYAKRWEADHHPSDWQAAEQQFQRAERVAPQQTLISLSRANLYLQMPDKAPQGRELLQQLREQLLQDPSTSPALIAIFSQKLAEALYNAHDYAAVVKLLQATAALPATSLLPATYGSCASQQVLMARALAAQQQFDAALTYSAQAQQAYAQLPLLTIEQQRGQQAAALQELAIFSQAFASGQLKSEPYAERLFSTVQIALGLQRANSMERIAFQDPQINPNVKANYQQLWEKEQELETKEKSYSQLLAQGQVPSAEFVRDMGELRSEIAQLDEKLRNASTVYKAHRAPQPLPVATAQHHLQENEALVQWVVDQTQAYLLIVRPKQTPQFFTLPNAKAENLNKALNTNSANNFFNSLRDPQQTFQAAQAYTLYQQLLEPAQNALKDVQHLLVITDQHLQNLPLPALLTAPPTSQHYADLAWLVKRYAISYLPSAQALQDLRRNPARWQQPPQLIGFGDPELPASPDYLNFPTTNKAQGLRAVYVPDALARLPETATEVQNIAQNFPDLPQQLWLGKDASKQQLQTLDKSGQLAQAQILIFAMHSAISIVNDVQPEPGLLMATGLNTGHDHLLRASEIALLHLNAEWVILSACKTGQQTLSDRDKGVSALAQAFFTAGARSVLATQWDINSQQTVSFMTRLFAQLHKTPTRATALQQTMLQQIQQRSVGDWLRETISHQPPRNHPAYWASFSIYGEGGNLTPRTLLATDTTVLPDDNSGLPVKTH